MGSVDPARDFRTLTKQKKLPFGEGKLHFFCACVLASHCKTWCLVLSPGNCFLCFFVWLWWPPVSFAVCQQLTQRIEQFLSNKSTQYYMKSITCIQAFREQSVKVNKHSLSRLCGEMNGDVGRVCAKSCWDVRVHSFGNIREMMSQLVEITRSLFHFSTLETWPAPQRFCVSM